MSNWQAVEKRDQAQLWRAPATGGFTYVVTDHVSNSFPDLGHEKGYDDAVTAWAAYEERRGIAREVDMNEM